MYDDVYYDDAAITESPYKLIQMLFEGILRFCAQAKHAMKNDDIEAQVYWINRTIDIFAELIGSLSFEHEESIGLSEYLKGLYTYQIKLLMEANIEGSIEKLDIVTKVATGLLEAWNEETGLDEAAQKVG